MTSSILILLVVLYFYLCGMAIYYAHRSSMYSGSQLIMQGAFVLLLPFVGAIAVLFFSLNQINSSKHTVRSERSSFSPLAYVFLSFILVKYSDNQSQNGASETNSEIDSNLGED